MDANNCCELIEVLAKTETVASLHDVCAEVCESHGFDRFIYGARIPTSFIKPHFIFISGYPREWRERYNAHNYMAIDPTVSHCARNVTPMIWHGVDEFSDASGEVRSFMGEAHDFGIRSGVSFPLHTAQGEFAMLSFATEHQRRVTEPHVQRVLPMGQLFTTYLHEAVRRIFSNKLLPLSQVNFTHRERECLLWASEGKTAWETSRILNISERTVTFHLQNVQGKLGVQNRQQAVARTVALGLVEPQFNL